MSQPPSEERRKFVLVFTGPAKHKDWPPEGTPAAPVEIIVTAWVLLMMKQYGWKSEMHLDLPLSARVHIEESGK